MSLSKNQTDKERPYSTESEEDLARRLNKLLQDLSEYGKTISPILVKMSHCRKEVDLIIQEMKLREVTKVG